MVICSQYSIFNNSVIQLLIMVVEYIRENVILGFMSTYGFYSGHTYAAKTVLMFTAPFLKHFGSKLLFAKFVFPFYLSRPLKSGICNQYFQKMLHFRHIVSPESIEINHGL